MVQLPFADAFMRERARFQVNRREVADQCGVAEGVVKRWERGDAVPNRVQFKRLVGMMPRMAPHFPSWEGLGDRIVTGAAEEEREHNRQAVDQLTKRIGDSAAAFVIHKPEPQEFGVGLRRVREENEVTQEELGALVGVEQGTVSKWESAETTPVKENILKLLELLPELKAGMETGAIRRPKSQDIDKPVGSFGHKFPRASTIDQALDMALQQSDEEAKRPLFVEPKHESSWVSDMAGLSIGDAAENERVAQSLRGIRPLVNLPTTPADEEPVHPHYEPEPSDANALAVAFVQARINLKRANVAVCNAVVALADAEAAAREAEQAVKDAEQLLELAISEAK